VSDHPEQKKDQDDEQDEAEAAPSVVAKAWPQPIPPEAEQQDENDEKNDHDASKKLLNGSDARFGLAVSSISRVAALFAAEGSEVNCRSVLALGLRAAIALEVRSGVSSTRATATQHNNDGRSMQSCNGPMTDWCVGTLKRAGTTAGCNEIEVIKKNDHMAPRT
jgi:hypothetical protein